MVERLLILVFLGVIAVAVYRLFARWQVSRANKLINAVDPVLRDFRKGTPAVLLFTTPFCAPCKSIVLPALERLQREMGDHLQVLQIDACERPEDADRWGVLSAPTTFILDASGSTRAVNHGVADYPLLKRQLGTLDSSFR